MDKKLLGNYFSLVWLEGTRQIKGPFNHARKAPIYWKALIDFYHDPGNIKRPSKRRKETIAHY